LCCASLYSNPGIYQVRLGTDIGKVGGKRHVVYVSAGAELRGAAAVACGFTSGTVIARNTIAHVPATAISLGWCGNGSFCVPFCTKPNICQDRLRANAGEVGKTETFLQGLGSAWQRQLYVR
jgi:hypothetical protein